MFKRKLKELFKYECGDLLRDKITGLEGVVMVRSEYSTGCHHYGIMQPSLKDDGTEYDWSYFDQSRLELVQKQSVKLEIDPQQTSGPMPNAPKQ